jgi:hypothetical protein
MEKAISICLKAGLTNGCCRSYTFRQQNNSLII